MTAQWRGDIECPNCGTVVQTEPEFDQWVRDNPMLDSVDDCISITDGDKWVHRYAVRTGGTKDRDVQYLMTVELKTHERDMTPSQRDTLHAANQLLRTNPWREQRDNGRLTPGHVQNVRVLFSTMNGRRIQLLCYGVHKLRMSGAGPLSSEWMTWDNHPVSVQQLTLLLRFDLSPDTLRPMEHRHHKRKPSQQDPLIELGDGMA